jgi:hypothetical protein
MKAQHGGAVKLPVLFCCINNQYGMGTDNATALHERPRLSGSRRKRWMAGCRGDADAARRLVDGACRLPGFGGRGVTSLVTSASTVTKKRSVV